MRPRSQVRPRRRCLLLLVDHELVAQHLLRVLRWRGALEQRGVGGAGQNRCVKRKRSVFRIISFEEVLSRRNLGREHRAVLLVDRAALPGAWVENLGPIQRSCPDAPILVIGKPANERELLGLLSAGAKGYVAYSDIPRHLARAIEHVSRGHVWLQQDAIDRLSQYTLTQGMCHPTGPSGFTPHEMIVLNLLQRRLSNKEIASVMAITERTVKYYLKNIYTKLGVHDRYSAADLARASHIPAEDSSRAA